jgi:hypothetical protein
MIERRIVAPHWLIALCALLFSSVPMAAGRQDAQHKLQSSYELMSPENKAMQA